MQSATIMVQLVVIGQIRQRRRKPVRRGLSKSRSRRSIRRSPATIIRD
jgi:hypothetical protein